MNNFKDVKDCLTKANEKKSSDNNAYIDDIFNSIHNNIEFLIKYYEKKKNNNTYINITRNDFESAIEQVLGKELNDDIKLQGGGSLTTRHNMAIIQDYTEDKASLENKIILKEMHRRLTKTGFYVFDNEV